MLESESDRKRFLEEEKYILLCLLEIGRFLFITEIRYADASVAEVTRDTG